MCKIKRRQRSGTEAITDLYMCYNKKCKNIPARLITHPYVLLVITAESLSTNEFVTTGGISLLPGQIILCDRIGS